MPGESNKPGRRLQIPVAFREPVHVPIAPGTKIGPYVVLAPLGAGAMGEVYHARDSRLARDVAIKVLPADVAADPERVRRFELEARAVAAISHPNILAIFDVGAVTVGDVEPLHTLHYLVTELLHGQTLRARLVAGPMPPEDVIDITTQLLRGLAAAHARDVVHRDLKPENIFITEDGAVKILDFGLAKTVAWNETALDREMARADTSPGLVMGTIGYMSPEQVKGAPIDARSDLFAVGAILYELLTGRRAFEADSAAETMTAILRDEPPPVHDSQAAVSSSIDDILRRCLAKQPADRYQTASELRGALESMSAGVAAVGSVPRPIPDRGPSVAVLPFVNLSADPDNEFFADGIAEEIITALSRVPGLRVAARTSAFAFRGRAIELAEVAAKLRVSAVLEGSVRRAGSRLRVSVQLVDVAGGYQLWSERYDREAGDIFAIQDDIAQAVVDRLKVTLGAGAPAALVTPAAHLEAYELYLRGRVLVNQRGAALGRGIEYFERALAVDPAYPLAYAGLAFALSLVGFYGHAPMTVMAPKVKLAARRALELDASLAEAHLALALMASMHDWNWPEAERQFQEAIGRDPRSSEARSWHAFLLSFAERFDEAIAEARLAIDLDPLSAVPLHTLSLVHFIRGQAGDALAAAERALALEPHSFVSYRSVGLAHYGAGRDAEARRAFEQALLLSARHQWIVAELTATLARAGELTAAAALHDELVARSSREYIQRFVLTVTTTALGRVDEALNLIEEAAALREPVSFARLWPFFDPLRPLPRFQAVLARVGRPA